MRHEHDRGVERLQVRLQPLERLDVEVVGGLVEQQQVGIAGQRSRQRRAGELAAGERLQRPVEVLVAEPEAVQGRVDGLAPVVPAGVLEPGLGGASRRRAWRCPSRPRPSCPRARSAAPPAPAAPCTRRARSRAATGRGRAAGAGRAGRRARPWRRRARRRRSRSRRESMRSSVVLPEPLRPDRVSRSRRSSLNETPRSRGSPAMSLARSEARTTAIATEDRYPRCMVRTALLTLWVLALSAPLALAARKGTTAGWARGARRTTRSSPTPAS